VADTSGRFGALEGSGIVLFVRPDRYVAAAVRAAEIASVFDQLAPMLPHLRSLFDHPLLSGSPVARPWLATS
jgi:hypothetical protein